MLIVRGLVDPNNLQGQIVDFGTGTGGGAYILQQYGGNVTGIDTSETFVNRTVEQGILPRERAIIGDGFQYLARLKPESLDFISAFMMHRDFPCKELYQRSERVLKKGGQLLITGGLAELKDELQTNLGGYGKVEEVITIHGTRIFGNCAFIYTKR